jgi:ketosteroid isomerase-like protein
LEIKTATADAKVPSQVVYSRDGQHVAKIWPNSQDPTHSSEQVTLDDKPVGPSYHRVQDLRLSDDGKHIAFSASAGDSRGSGDIVVFDGEEGARHSGIYDVVMTPDGRHIAYSAEDGAYNAGVWHVVVDGFAGPDFDYDRNYYLASTKLNLDGSLTFVAALKGQLARYTYPAEALKVMPTMVQTESVTAGVRELQKPGTFSNVEHDLVLGPNETLYAVARSGGQYGNGALFSCKTNGSDLKILHSFYGNKESGPTNSLAGNQENVWGTAGSSVFRYDIRKGEYTVVTSEHSLSGLRGILPDGSLLGEEGFSDRHWWMLSQDGSSLETTPRQEGVWHQIAAVGPDGAIYWTASDSLYRQTSFWSEPKLLHKFEDSPEEGKDVAPLVTVDPTGTIYGFAKGRTASIIYRVRPDGSDFRVLVPQSRGLKVSSLVAGDDAMLYGCFTAELKTADSQTAGFFSLPAAGGNPAILPNVKSGTDHALIYHHAAIYYTDRSSVVRVQLPSSSGAARQTPVLTIKTVAPPALASAEPVTFTTSSGESIPSAKAPHGQAGAAIWQPPAPGSTIATVSKQSPPRDQNRLLPSSGGNPPDANFGNEAPSGQALSQQEATTFAVTTASAMSAGDINALASFYADQIDYQDKGVINNDAVRNEFQQYFARWPRTNWQLAGTVAVQPVGPSRYQISFPVSFDATNPSTNKHATGVARETMILIQNGSGAWRIVMERQTITSKKSDDRRRRLEREKVYQGRPADDNRPRIPLPPNIPWPPDIPHP